VYGDKPRAQYTTIKIHEIAAAFLEDKAVVEGQQTRLTELGEADVVDIVSDVARIHMRRVVDRLLAAEQPRRTAAAE
jgi:hypothetical protein